MRLPDSFIRTVRSVHGEQGEAWLLAFPELLRNCEERWSLQIGEPFSLSFNFAAPVRLPDGREGVLKLGVPSKDFRSEAAALRQYGGDGAVQVWEALPDEGVLLLERAQPGKTLHTVKETEAVEAAAEIMRKLRKPAPKEQEPFQTVQGWFRGLERLREHYGGGTGPFPENIVELAEERLADLQLTAGKLFLLHGDLHHGNILSARREPWLAIDPKGVIGEAEFEPSAFLMNHIDPADPAAQIRLRVKLLADHAGLDPQRVLAWAFCFAVLSAWWSLADGVNGADERIGLARHLNRVIMDG